MYNVLLTAMIVVGVLIILAVDATIEATRCFVSLVRWWRRFVRNAKGTWVRGSDATNHGYSWSYLVYFGIGTSLPFFTLNTNSAMTSRDLLRGVFDYLRRVRFKWTHKICRTNYLGS